MKDTANEALASARRRRVPGLAAQTLICAFLLFAANLRKIDAWLAELAEARRVAGTDLTEVPRKRAKRRTESLDRWRSTNAGNDPPRD